MVGAGVRTPAGNTLPALWRTLCRGESTATLYRDERLPDGVEVLVCRVRDVDPTAYLTPQEARRWDRVHHLAAAAADDALAAAGTARPAPQRCAVVCGTGFGAGATYEAGHDNLTARGMRAISPLMVPMSMMNSTAALLSIRYGFKGPCQTVVAACASGASAIGEGLELLRRDAADLVLAGGVDAMLSYGTLCSFLRLDAMSRHVAHPQEASRPFDANRDGFVMAEGAGFVVLQRLADATAAGRPILGTVVGYGTCADAHHLVAPSPEGEGAQRAMALSLADAGCELDEISHVNAHGTSTILNDLAEASAISALFGSAAPPVTAVKGSTGHMIGGSGAVEAITTLLSLQHRIVPPIAGHRTADRRIDLDLVVRDPRPIGAGMAISNSFGFGGANACLVLGGQ